jgi:imidazole glycerol phosphate synthase glutamine amidotransferase subunit
MIGIINLNCNNLSRFEKIIKDNNMKSKIIHCLDDYNSDIEKLIIPGIGNFRSVMDHVKVNHLDIVIKEHFQSGKPIFAICIGLQILTKYGTEGGYTEGIGIIDGFADTLFENNQSHLGWNTIKKKNGKCLDLYFAHSYCITLFEDIIHSTCVYKDNEFVSSIKKKNLYATQFHPEKSSINGLKIILKFLNKGN